MKSNCFFWLTLAGDWEVVATASILGLLKYFYRSIKVEFGACSEQSARKFIIVKREKTLSQILPNIWANTTYHTTFYLILEFKHTSILNLSSEYFWGYKYYSSAGGGRWYSSSNPACGSALVLSKKQPCVTCLTLPVSLWALLSHKDRLMIFQAVCLQPWVTPQVP